MDQRTTMEFAERFANAHANLDLDEMLSMVADDVTFELPLSVPDRFVQGKGALAKMFSPETLATWGFVPGSGAGTVEAVLAAPDHAVALLQMGSDRVDGSRYENDYAFSYRFQDGLVASIKEYADTAVVRSRTD